MPRSSNHEPATPAISRRPSTPLAARKARYRRPKADPVALVAAVPLWSRACHQVPRPFLGMSVLENTLVAAQHGASMRGAAALKQAQDALDRDDKFAFSHQLLHQVVAVGHGGAAKPAVDDHGHLLKILRQLGPEADAGAAHKQHAVLLRQTQLVGS